AFVLKNMDSTSEAKPFLPVYMTENLSDCYNSTDPHKSKEIIRAAKTEGLKNESMLQFLVGFNQRVNVYDNYSTALGKEFISPLSDIGDKYYQYRGADTQYIAGKRYLHLFFQPKRAGENTFSGDCWILDGNWGIYRITLDISGSADINYVNRLSVVQEFALQPDSSWIFRKEKTVIDFAPFKKEKLSFIARRTELYRNVVVNDTSIARVLQTNREKDEVTVDAGAREKDAVFWNNRRHEDLTITEKKVYQMMDTIKTVPAFIHYTHVLTFVFDGHHAFGPLEIGPWFKWISGNQLEKIRTRFDLGTTQAFSKSLRLHGYLAYGFGDGKFKGKFDISFKPAGQQGWTYFASYTHDLDNGRTRYNDEDITTDNIFSQLIRRPGIRQKFLGVDEIKLSVTKEWASHFSIQPFLIRTDYDTYLPLPSRSSLFSRPNQDALISTEAGIKLRYAPGERSITTHRRERKFRTDQPVLELRAAWGLPHILRSEYQYQRIGMNISQNFRIPRWGKLSYMAYAGKIYSDAALPFMMLEIHPGNEIYYYNHQSFNLMNRFEYISDRFVGFNMEHNLEKKFLNLLPFLRKTSIRQFWNLKSVWGDLSDDNRQLNIKDYFYAYRMRSLRGGIYTELGTGLENIFKLLRVDLVWRFAPLRNIPAGMNPALFKSPTDFGVFGSVRLQL
ncbi:MAG TPA: DUF5686 family protein, partial [Sediminibacterium sp.]|nr:DUF5686 family protein [Sediminibacterium sp.]